jgi:hypothetical protein
MAREGQPNRSPDPGVQRQMLAPQGPPRPYTQQHQPQPIALERKRSAGDFFAGLAAIILLAGLVVGVPLALAAFIGWPLPHKMPDARFLNSAITASTFTNTLAVLVWIAWAQFTACVVVEVIAAIRGIGMPGHVPLSGGSQIVARRLVAAVLLITASTASFAPGVSNLGRHHDAPRPTVTASASATAGAHAHASIDNVARSHTDQSRYAAGIPTHMDSPGLGASARPNVNADTGGATKFYRVVPPQGRHHDSLWEIAQRHLGDGRRYQEIYDLNKDKVQPDGSKLTKASLIRPGWILEMPADAHGGDLVDDPSGGAHAAPAAAPAAASAAAHATAPTSAPTTAPATGPTTASADGPSNAPALAPDTSVTQANAVGDIANSLGGGGDRAEHTIDSAYVPSAASIDRPGLGARGAPDTGPSALSGAQSVAMASFALAGAEHAAPAAGSAAAATADHQAPASNQSPFRLPYEIMASPLLAAGLLAALSRNRRRQLWHRAFGRRLPGVDPLAGGVEEAIRLGAEAGEAQFLDRALRELVAAAAAAGVPLPAVFGARLNDEGLELLLTDPSPQAPAPWTARGDGRAWFVGRAAVGSVPDATVAQVAAPYPGLVSVGVDGQSRRFLDLEAASGVICVDGDDTKRRAFLAATAVELATNTWSDRMTVTLVGFPGDLAPLAPGRIHQVGHLREILPLVQMEVDERRRSLERTGQLSVLSGRRDRTADAVPPHFIISARQLEPQDAAALAEMANGVNRIGIGCLIAGNVPAAVWQLTVDPAGRLTAPLLDLDVSAQSLPDDQYRAVLDLFAATSDWGGVPVGQMRPEPGALEARFGITPTVSVALLGELEVTGAGHLEPERRQPVWEALTYLMLHPGGANPAVLASALWPRGVASDVSDAVLGRLAAWLGTAPDGSPNLMRLQDGRIAVGPYVRSDWQMFTDLRAVADHDPRFANPADRDRVLSQALTLVRGPLLIGRDPARYGWLAYEAVEREAPAVIADTAVELCELRLAAGNADGAVEAVRAGMLASPADEELWRALLRATHATGDAARLEETVNALWRQTQEMPGGRGLHPKTEALVEELLPSWRASVAAGGG